MSCAPAGRSNPRARAADRCAFRFHKPFDVRQMAERMRMALIHDEKHDLWALGPQSDGHVLSSAELPDVVLPDQHGKDFELRSLRGTKVFMIAWASW